MPAFLLVTSRAGFFGDVRGDVRRGQPGDRSPHVVLLAASWMKSAMAIG